MKRLQVLNGIEANPTVTQSVTFDVRNTQGSGTYNLAYAGFELAFTSSWQHDTTIGAVVVPTSDNNFGVPSLIVNQKGWLRYDGSKNILSMWYKFYRPMKALFDVRITITIDSAAAITTPQHAKNLWVGMRYSPVSKDAFPGDTRGTLVNVGNGLAGAFGRNDMIWKRKMMKWNQETSFHTYTFRFKGSWGFIKALGIPRAEYMSSSQYQGPITKDPDGDPYVTAFGAIPAQFLFPRLQFFICTNDFQNETPAAATDSPIQGIGINTTTMKLSISGTLTKVCRLEEKNETAQAVQFLNAT